MRKLRVMETRFVQYIVVYPLLLGFVCFFACTSAPAAWKWVVAEEFAIDNTHPERAVEIPKAMMASACTGDKLHCLENVLLIYGEIDEGTKVAIERLAERNPSLAVNSVCLSSPGGNVAVAVWLGRKIKDLKLSTCLADLYAVEGLEDIKKTRCHSACGWILLSGKKRWQVGHEFSIALHHPGGVLDFCFCDFRLNSYWDWFSLEPVEDMLLYQPSIDIKEHLALFERSQKTDFSKGDYLDATDWKKYSIFSEKIN